MTTTDQSAGSDDLYRFAFAKVARVLGPDRARQLLERLLAELRLELRTADDLLVLGQRMSQMGGFEGAVGAMLGVAAALRGATAPR